MDSALSHCSRCSGVCQNLISSQPSPTSSCRGAPPAPPHLGQACRRKEERPGWWLSRWGSGPSQMTGTENTWAASYCVFDILFVIFDCFIIILLFYWWTTRTSWTHVAHGNLTSCYHLLLPGLAGVPVADQTVVLHAVVLVADQPVRVHFAFTLPARCWGGGQTGSVTVRTI